MKTTRDSRRMFVSWLHDPTSERLSVRAWAVGEDMAKDCDELEAKCAALQAESDAHAKWLEETWPTIEDNTLGALVRERNEALAKVAALTHERDHLRTCLGFWEGQHLERVVRERDENAALAGLAMTAGLTECERLAEEVESLADSLGDTRAHCERGR